MRKTRESKPACLEFTDVFQHDLMEEPPTSSAPLKDRSTYQMLVRRAMDQCAACPLSAQCLYDAVVKHDVAGFAAGTTQRQRQEIRRELGVTVRPEDLDTLAGVTARHRQVNHDEVVRLRNANPHESLETIANRLGCSLSTVKRHLRRARAAAANPAPEQGTRTLPTMRDVVNAYHAVLGGGRSERAA